MGVRCQSDEAPSASPTQPCHYSHGEKLSADSSSASAFVTKFSEILREEDYDLELIYSGDEVGKQGKPVLLLLDNALSHPDADSLTRNGFEVIFLSPNVTSIIQSMDQNVIQTIKRNYRKQFLRRLLPKDNHDKEEEADSTIMFFRSMDLKDCCYMLLKRHYEDLNGLTCDLLPLNEGYEEPELVTEVFDALEFLKAREDCDKEDVPKWLNCDAND
ncbi:hypothetical protein ILUMI_20643 [Ignelater luminosus]|uniref:DDE-1 domain-containing protein n=1 Tax=Ignelater luminosus TaxID=2038154 RepID=A0A8K0G4M4_IGNLU|nr:hypothetical protein ILUMI_20643 [Ignelater luminosus]